MPMTAAVCDPSAAGGTAATRYNTRCHNSTQLGGALGIFRDSDDEDEDVIADSDSDSGFCGDAKARGSGCAHRTPVASLGAKGAASTATAKSRSQKAVSTKMQNGGV
jgi:hypothetical protein